MTSIPDIPVEGMGRIGHRDHPCRTPSRRVTASLSVLPPYSIGGRTKPVLRYDDGGSPREALLRV
ncbi:hypothetical protein GCM10010219_39360 [Streptomyces netropsis]|nr:hypothetical protein GCM10010219_39360 [Streptomyces netropsis]